MKLSDTGNRLLLIIQSVLCVVLTALLIAAAVGVYREGAARKRKAARAAIGPGAAKRLLNRPGYIELSWF